MCRACAPGTSSTVDGLHPAAARQAHRPTRSFLNASCMACAIGRAAPDAGSPSCGVCRPPLHTAGKEGQVGCLVASTALHGGSQDGGSSSSSSTIIVVSAATLGCIAIAAIFARRSYRRPQGGSERVRLRRQVEEVEVKNRFLRSMANTHPHLTYEITGVRKLDPVPQIEDGLELFEDSLPHACTATERKRLFVFHTCKCDVLALVEKYGMRPSLCEKCRGKAAGNMGVVGHDSGWFGDHTKGVYVSKHADYTFYYQRDRKPEAGGVGTVVMLEMVTGKVMPFTRRCDGAPPSVGFHSHDSPTHLEFYIWDDETTAEPPRPTHRAVPRFAVSWRAVRNARAGIVHDGGMGQVGIIV